MQIRIVKSDRLGGDLRAKVLALCSDAYEEDFTPHMDKLGEATHVLAEVNGDVLSHAAWIVRELRVGRNRQPLYCAYVEAVATPLSLQRKGFGSAVLRAIPAYLGSFDIAALSPSESDFYARSGWEKWEGPLFYVQRGTRFATPGEEVMILRLPKTPSNIDLFEELETDWRPGDVW